MSEENNSLPEGERPQRTVRMKLDGKFGVSEERKERGIRGPDSRIAGDRKFAGPKKPQDYRDRGDRPAFGDRGNDRGGYRNDRPAFGDRGNDRGGYRNDRPAFGDRGNDRGGYRNDRSAPAGHKRFGNRDDRPTERKVWNEDTGAPVFRQRRHEDQPELAPELLALETPDLVPEVEAEKDPPWFRRIVALSTEKGREREEKFLAEGLRVVAEMVQYHPDIVDGIYVTEGFSDEALQENARNANLRIHELTAEQMAKVSTTVTGPGVVAVCRTASRKPDYDRAHLITLVDAIQDPGNLGALFRTSLGFGSGGMLLGKGTVNPFNPKVVRGSSGTFLRVPFEHGVDLQERIQFLRQKGYCIVATDLHAKQSLADISPRKLRKVALIMGNEGMGAEKGLIEQADEWVRIPMGESLESLNVSVAHGILSFQLAQLQEKVQ